ncbi:hypothetical protein [Agromyces indicus]|uniref:Uncharacterized protein n=1 Tax=Agromyces indicus TaxID=758919 RepID=A0ABU1FIJ3_9MICO|nr:hypothetical protein [Agromyces indicus]MDR5691266.1 hypothetical protein [Agromyces indicus]
MTAKEAIVQFVGRFAALPKRVRMAAIAGGLVVVVGAVSIPVAAVAVEEHHRQHALEVAAMQAAAERVAEEANALAEAKDEAAGLNAELAGLTGSLGATVHPDAAAALEDARIRLAFAIAGGDHDAVASSFADVTEALRALVASAEGQAAALIDASPLAGGSRDALTRAIADLATADDVVAALHLVKDASDAVVAAQKAGVAAAEAAAKEAAAREAEARARSGGSGGGGGQAAPDGGSGAGSSESPGIIGMEPGARGSCGENPTGQVVTLGFGWQAREGNTVAISYAYTDGDYQATGGFILLASGLGPSGSVSIPVPCPVGPGPHTFVTVKAVASNANGSAAAYYWGL